MSLLQYEQSKENIFSSGVSPCRACTHKARQNIYKKRDVPIVPEHAIICFLIDRSDFADSAFSGQELLICLLLSLSHFILTQKESKGKPIFHFL
jgi:hypothetical protein